jgi:hypothetical protein
MAHKDIVHKKIRECIGINLEANEELYLVIRKHWIILVETWIFLLILCALSAGIYFIGVFANITLIFVIITIIGLFMVWLQYIFVRWVNNELDILIITNRRIIAYDQIKFLDRKMCQTTIDLVQEVNATTSGLLGNILRYWTITIRTASDSATNLSDFNITDIPNPIETSQSVHTFIDAYRHSLDPNNLKHVELHTSWPK